MEIVQGRMDTMQKSKGEDKRREGGRAELATNM